MGDSANDRRHRSSLVPLQRQGALREDASPENVAKLARRAVDRYELELLNHFEIEEQILFPAIENALGKLPLVASLIAQHRQVEDLIAQLRSAPDAALLERLCGLLAEHIRREESDLFQMAQSRLPEPILRELGTAIEAKVVRICL